MLPDLTQTGLALAVIGLLIKELVVLAHRRNGTGPIEAIHSQIRATLDLVKDIKSELLRLQGQHEHLSEQINAVMRQAAVNDWRITKLEEKPRA